MFARVFASAEIDARKSATPASVLTFEISLSSSAMRFLTGSIDDWIALMAAFPLSVAIFSLNSMKAKPMLFAVSAAMLTAVTWAALLGCLVPMGCRRLAIDPAIVAGETGGTGLAALLAARDYAGIRSTLGLAAGSRVLLLGSEGDTDAQIYREVIGRTAEEVLA